MRKQYTTQFPKSAIYQRVKSRLFKKNAYLDNTLIDYDENGFYIPIPEEKTTIDRPYQQTYQDRLITHTTRRVVTQRAIDLEEYRFNAYKERTLLSPCESVSSQYYPELRHLLATRYQLLDTEIESAIERRQITWEELFCEFYYLKPSECTQYDYKTWLYHYSCVPELPLNHEFTLSLDKIVGSPDFYPEWAYKRASLEEAENYYKEQEKLRKKTQFIQNMKWRKR